ncbi:BSD domain [Trinorchestia longiramus]|nr:BSD domain [Trinorchestia longiramus]
MHVSHVQERKNFVRNPPTGVIFEFDLDQFLPVAQATLAADSSLEKMRFELVPKVVSEEVFWRNYFYRVGLIRQSTELSSLEQDSDGNNKTPSENKAPTPEPAAAVSAEAVVSGASESLEFVSESFQPSSEDLEEIKRDVSSLTQAEEKEEDDWEAELREELGGFEVVEGGGGGKTGGKGDDQWEEEIQNMIDEEEDDTSDLR